MRTNLLRFMFDSAWRFEAAGNELYVGAGWLILIWTLVVSVLCVRLRQSEGSWSEALLAAGAKVRAFDPAKRAVLEQQQYPLVADRDGVPYPAWAAEEFITPTPGNVVDFRSVEDTIRDLCTRFDVREIAFDPHLARVTMNNLLEDGYPAVEMRQGWITMAPAVKELERAIIGRKFRHGGHPVHQRLPSPAAAPGPGAPSGPAGRAPRASRRKRSSSDRRAGVTDRTVVPLP